MLTEAIQLIGHRGYAARYPENTIPSLTAALMAGAAGVEWDVRFAACGTPVLLHDDTLDRTTDGAGPVEAHPFEALRRLDAGSWFGPAFAGVRIPSLAEALQATLGPQLLHSATEVFVEVKAAPNEDALLTLLHTLRGADALERAVVISMDFALLRKLRLLAPRLRLGWVAATESSLEEALGEVRRDPHALLDPDHNLLRARPTETTRWIEEGLPLLTWTVNRERHARELLSMGVRRITTDDPGRLREQLTPPLAR